MPNNVTIPADTLRVLVSAAESVATEYERILAGPEDPSAASYAERLVTVSAAIRIAARALAGD